MRLRAFIATGSSLVLVASASAATLAYSSYFGGANEERANGIALDRNGNAIAVGETASVNFPIRNAVQTTNATTIASNSPNDAYMAKFTPAIEKPPLSILRSGSSLLITWPTNFTGFTLEYAGALGPAASWAPITTPPLLISTEYTVVEKAAGARRFYRLRRP